MNAEDERFQAGWRKSTYSTNGGDCVEIAISPSSGHPAARKSGAQTLCMIRDSKNPNGPRLYFAPAEWIAFTAGMKAGTSGNPG
jgi:hypothetical protein